MKEIKQIYRDEKSPSAQKVEVSVENAAYGDWLLRPTQSEFKNRHIAAFIRGANWQASQLQSIIKQLEGDNYILTQSLAEWKERAEELQSELLRLKIINEQK